MADQSDTFRQPPDLSAPEVQLPAVMSANERRVRRGFWKKIGRVASRLPFAETALAAYYCAIDPATPLKAKAILFAALAYFVVPLDMIPDVVAVFGFTDDAAVIFAAVNLISIYMKPRHYEQAQVALDKLRVREDDNKHA